ncbi:MAG TPA: tetratricopeptide repeat protein [Gammaproteobacteria bacterium]|jgi:tetratricopeptide (TPR) repeat protein
MILRHLTIACLVSLLAGCAASVPKPAASAPPAFRGVDQEIAYHVFMGELAVGRGDAKDAVQEYQAAARLSTDPSLAAHAAVLAYGDGDLIDALALARRWQTLAPNSADATHLVAVLETERGDAAAAARDFAGLVQSGADPNYMAAARLLEQETDASHGLPVLQAIIAGAPKSANAHYALAHAAMDYKRYALAEQEARTALALDPRTDEPLVLLARALVAQGKVEEALPLIQARVKAAGDDVSLDLAYGALLSEAKHDSESKQEFESVLKAHPGNADALYTLGLMTLQDKDPSMARDYFERLLKTGRRSDDANYFLGSIAETEKLYPDALDWYRRVEDGDHWLAAQAGIGRSLIKSGADSAAGEFFDGLVADDPQATVDLRLAEGQVFTDVGQPRRALEVYDDALHSVPDNQDLLYARALLLEQAGDANAAENDLAVILKHAPDDADALNALGYTLTLHTTRYREAQSYIQRALALQPDDPAIMDSMGWVEHRLGQDVQALDYLQKAYVAQPDPEIAAHLVEVMLATGDHDGAHALWLKASAADPDNPALTALASRFQP